MGSMWMVLVKVLLARWLIWFPAQTSSYVTPYSDSDDVCYKSLTVPRGHQHHRAQLQRSHHMARFEKTTEKDESSLKAQEWRYSCSL